MKPLYLTKEQLEKLQTELHHLKRNERTKVIKEIAEAREKGDLSENAEYDAAKEKQLLIERKIARLEETLSRARILSAEMMNNDQVHVGSRVVLVDEGTQEETVYELVPTAEFHSYDLDAISIDSPVGKALVGKAVDDIVSIRVPAGEITYRVKKIS
ncbi:MAG TPA: transcription elongation factor GreA [bacterium]|jgi:transcription elongation factor GreA|nr:transcription elongation factor GreA [bacterium]HNY91350.1 transcription elongation factor GreA [bacterium]HOC23946.1 transcription elongation factor GreA [bacterium]HOH06628.1 transcription elongation factor GreA [bacterium]HOY44100.1 transcription elongation factor GreA [bacterium]